MGLRDFRLFMRLQLHDPGLASGLDATWDAASKLLATISSSHAGFTSHGPDHSLAVLKILGDALEPLPDVANGLSDAELYVVICGALLHDIGMVGPVGAAEGEQQRIRRGHHIRSMDFIQDHGGDLLIPPDLRSAIAKTVAAHRGGRVEEILPQGVVTRGSEIRLWLCAALVRLADECHAASDRVPGNYSILALPEDSESHFRAHSLISGPLFDAASGTVRFSTTLYLDDDDTWVRDKLAGIQTQLALLAPVLGRYGIPYKDISCKEDRTEVARKRVQRELLCAGHLTCAELAERTGETPETIRSTMGLVGESPPFESTVRVGERIYSLEMTEHTFLDLAVHFLNRPERANDPVLFLQSELARGILTDSWLSSRFSRFLADPKTAPLVWRMLRLSPSALRSSFRSVEDSAPGAQITGAGGFVVAVLGNMLNDFLSFPSLLLAPGIVDDIYATSLVSEKDWQRLRIRLIATYHEAFKEEAVLEQWVTPSEWELRAERTEDLPKSEMEVSFRGKHDQIGDPLLQLAAARRLGLPLTLTSTPSVTISVKSETGPKPLQAGKSVEAIVLGGEGKSPILTGVVPARFEQEQEGGAFSLVARLAEPPATHDWAQPLRCHIRVLPTKQDEAGRSVRPVTSTLSLLLDNLDGSQAALLLKMAESPGSAVRFPWLSDQTVDSLGTTDQLAALLKLGESQQERAFLHQLGRLQQLTGKRIPVPLYRLAAELENMVVETSPSTGTQAQELLDRVLERLAEIGKPTVSPFIAEIYVDGALRDRQYLDAAFGIHMPRLRFGTEAGGWIGAPGDELDRVFGDPEQYASAVGAMQIRLSPQAALEVLRSRPRSVNDEEHVDITALKEFEAGELVEARTEVSLCWERRYETLWSSVTPFILKLQEHPSWERWFMESHYFLNESRDVQRAYASAREAFRIRPDDVHVRVNMGWSAFLADRTEEALAITVPATKVTELADQCIAFANAGLFHLRLGATARDPSRHIAAARESYEKTKTLLASLGEGQADRIRADVLGDLRAWSDSIHPEASSVARDLAPRAPVGGSGLRAAPLDYRRG